MLTKDTIKTMKDYHNNILLHILDNTDKAVISNDIRSANLWYNYYVTFHTLTETLERLFKEEDNTNSEKELSVIEKFWKKK